MELQGQAPAFDTTAYQLFRSGLKRLLRIGLLATAAMLPLAVARADKLVSGGTTPVTSSTYPGVDCQIFQVPMRDGTRLSTRAYYPSAGAGPYPAVMQRDPYDRAFGGTCFGGGLDAVLIALAQNGYVAMDQSVRGTYTSQGVFKAMIQEAQDGYDAIEWVGTRPWSTGKVGTTSGSYLGLTQWQPAIHHPPHLFALAPQITASDYHDNWTYVNGVLDLWFAMSWVPGFVTDQITRDGQAEGESAQTIEREVTTWNNLTTKDLVPKWVSSLPLTDFQPFRQFPPYYTWVDHEYYDQYWARMDVEGRYDNVLVPALINSASYDIFAVGSLRNFHGMRTSAGTAEARAGTKLIFGAYGHPGDSGHPTFGSDGGEGTLLPASVELPFFDRYLKGIKNGWERQPVVQIYVLVPPNSGDTGTGFWISGQDFPLPGTDRVQYFLQSGGHANTSKGDGALVTSAGGGGPADQFAYDPKKPVPTMGGAMCCNAVLIPEGAQDQATVEARRDVLVYTGKTLARDQAVIGKVTANFWAISSAPDTDFTVKLVDVHPDGLTHNVVDRIVRASLRRGSKLPPKLIQPGVAYEYTLEVGNTATMFRTGHRVRVEISSSNFPHYGRNLNTGKSANKTAQTAIAYQTILHDAQHPSFIELPINPGVQIPPK